MIPPDDINPAPMRYGLLGEDTGTSAEKLAKFSGRVTWDYLVPHYKSGVLYFVDPSLPLETVGAAIAHDDATAVAAWRQSGDLVKIEAIHAAQWESGAPAFEALVVSPFVLCRPVPEGS